MVETTEIPQSRLDRGFELHRQEYEEAALRALRSGWYILGKEVEEFEKQFALFVGSKYTIGVASGLDALVLAFRSIDIGQGAEVIVPANTFIASVMAVSMNGATPVLVEPDDFYNMNTEKIEDLITPRTKAILVVHLYGQAANMTKVMQVAKKHQLAVVEDCAQSQGARHNLDGNRWVTTGNIGDIGCFSFYPSKNLGAFGDAGACVTNSKEIATRLKVLRNYGSEKRYYNQEIGFNSRLDEIQAALLTVRLKYLPETNNERQKIANEYTLRITNPIVAKPRILKSSEHVYHQYVIKLPNNNLREELIEHLKINGVGSIVHYPVPPHLSDAFAFLGKKPGDYPIAESYANTVLSLPMYTGMSCKEIKKVAAVVNEFKP